MSSVGGIQSLIALCESRGQKFDLLGLQSSDPSEHHYGPDSKDVSVQKIIGKARIAFYTSQHSSIYVTFYVTRDPNPILLGRNFWDDSTLRPLSMPWDNVVSVLINGKRETIPSFRDPTIGNLRRMKLLVPPPPAISMKSNISSKRSSLEILKEVHEKTHAPYKDIQLLLERTGHWSPLTAQELANLRRSCHICSLQSDPKPNTKYGLKISPEFNKEVCVDVAYLDASLLSTTASHASELYSGSQMAVLHVMCNRTWYSEVELITSRKLDILIDVFDCIWSFNHGYPKELYIDSEFDKDIFHKFLSDNSIQPKIVPPRRHNKLRIERKNRTLKCFIRKLRSTYPQKTLRWSAKKASFLANVFYGSQSISPFELGRGYTPRISDGSKLALIDPEIIEAYLDDKATRNLNRILRHRKHQNRVPEEVQIGDRILAYTGKSFGKRGSWSEYQVHSIELDRSSLTVKPDKRERRFAPEDILLLPHTQLATDVVKQRAGLESFEDIPKEAVIANVIWDETYESENATNIQSSADNDSVLDNNESHEGVDMIQADESSDFENSTLSNGDSAINHSTHSSEDSERADENSAANDRDSDRQLDVSDNEAQVYRETGAITGTDETVPQLRRSTRLGKGVPSNRYGFSSSISSIIDQLNIGQDLREQEYNEWLKRIHERFGGYDRTRNQLSWVPHWVLDKALQTELRNYEPVVELICSDSVPPHANVIDSHTLYKVKVKDGGSLQLKARIVPHGNKDLYKELIRSDSEVAEHSSYRTVMAFAAIFSIELFKVDVKAVFLQSGPARRTVYVRPPYDAFMKGRLWKLKAAVYGLTEANRVFQQCSDDVLSNPKKMGLSSIQCTKQLFAKYDSSGSLILLVAKQVDDLLCAGTEDAKRWFIDTFKKYFRLGTIVCSPDPIRFDGGFITVQENGDVQFSMEGYLNSLSAIKLTRERRRQQHEKANAAEIKVYQEKAGQFCWLGMGAYPMGYFYGSYLQQRLGDLRVRHLCLANGVIAEAKKFSATLVYRSGRNVGSFIPRVLAITDAGGSNKESLYYQQGELIGLTFGENPDSNFYLLDWKSCKQRRIAQSAGAAEGIAAHTGAHRGIVIREMLETLTRKVIPLDLVIDSMSLYRGMVTSHDPHDISMRKDIAALRELYGM